MYQTCKFILPILFVLLTACTDGTQVSTRINELIEDHKIETVVVEMDGQAQEYDLPQKGEQPQIIIEEQFMRLGDEYINLSHIRSLKVNDKALEVKL